MNTPRIRKPVPNRLALSLLLALAAGDASATIWITTLDDPDPLLSTDTCSLRQALNSVTWPGVMYPDQAGVGSCVYDGQTNWVTLEMVPWLSNGHLMLQRGELYMNYSGRRGLMPYVVIVRGHGLVIDAHQASRVIRYEGGTSDMEGGTVILADVTLTGGRAVSSQPPPVWMNAELGGAALITNYGQLYLVRSRVTGNEADFGGGIAAVGRGEQATNFVSTVALVDSSVDHNTAYRGGGFHMRDSGGLILRSTIANNQSTRGGGGGVYALQTRPHVGANPNRFEVWNSTISGNAMLGTGWDFQYSGSAIRSYGQNISLNHATITGNTGAWSAAIDVWPGADQMPPVSITNSIISGNTMHPDVPDSPVYNPDFSQSGVPVTVTHSILGTRLASAFSSGGNAFTDTPLLGALADHGGFATSYLPLADSPALDFGDDTACATLLPYPPGGLLGNFILNNPNYNYYGLLTTADERNVSRPQGAHCDAGAVERRQGNFTIAANASGQGRVDALPLPSGAGSSGGISNCTSAGGAACGAIYVGENDIATLTFTATPATGWHLDAWSGDCIASMRNASAQLAVDGDRSCNASFAIDTHTIGGFVQGLAGSGLVLQLDGANDLTIAADGHFTFPGTLDYGTPYNVTIATQPAGQTCFIPHGSGVADHDINIMVVCAEQPIPVAVSVTIDDGADLVLPGDTPAYQIVVRNDGDATAYGVSLATHVTPAGALEAPSWSCAGDCWPAGGNGDVAVDLDIPAHAQVTVSLHGSVVAFAGASLDVSAQVTVPDGYVDATGTHAATDSNVNPIIFRNGFDGVN